MDKDIILKRSVLGGFDKKQVMDYIGSLQAECCNREAAEEINETKKQIDSLKFILDEKNHAISELQELVEQINLNKSKDNSPNDFIGAFSQSEEHIKVAKEAANTINDCILTADSEIDPLLNKLSSISGEVENIEERLTNISEKFDELSFETDDSADDIAVSYSDDKRESDNVESCEEENNIDEIINRYTSASLSIKEKYKSSPDNELIVNDKEAAENENNTEVSDMSVPISEVSDDNNSCVDFSSDETLDKQSLLKTSVDKKIAEAQAAKAVETEKNLIEKAEKEKEEEEKRAKEELARVAAQEQERLELLEQKRIAAEKKAQAEADVKAKIDARTNAKQNDEVYFTLDY